MVSLKAVKRNLFGRKTKRLKRASKVPAILYGEGLKEALPLEVDLNDFKDVFQEAGTSSLVELVVDKNRYEVLVHDVAYDSLTDEIIHIDFYKPSTKRRITAEVPLAFKGVSPAQKDLGGNLLKEIQEVEVKGLAHQLPKEIVVDLSSLKTFDDKITVGDLKVPEGIEILRESDEVVALVVPPRKEEVEATPQGTAETAPGEEKKEPTPGKETQSQ